VFVRPILPAPRYNSLDTCRSGRPADDFRIPVKLNPYPGQSLDEGRDKPIGIKIAVLSVIDGSGGIDGDLRVQPGDLGGVHDLGPDSEFVSLIRELCLFV